VINNEEGIALFMALIIILFSALMTVMLVGISIINLKLSGNIAGYKKAVYAAQAGSEYARAVLIENGFQISDFNNSINLANNSSFNVNIDSNESNKYVIESKGKYYKNIKIFKTDIKKDNN